MKVEYIDDYSRNNETGTVLEAVEDNQGDLHLRIKNSDGTFSESIRFCGFGGGSRYTGLSFELRKILFKEWKL